MATLSTRKKSTSPRAAAEDSSAFGPIAERFRRAGDLDRAVSLCREGLQKFPQNISARVTLGWALLELGKFDEAREELEQVLRRRPDNLAAIRALAELHDRSEHTLNLPMDGPGQWPPTEDAVEQAATASVTEDVVTIAGVEAPEQTQEPVLLVSGHGHVAGYSPTEAVMASPGADVAMWSPAAASEIQPEVAAAAEELTAFAAVSLHAAPMPFAEPDAAHESGVSEADIAALLAEAEQLEVAAETADASRDLVLEADVDLSALGLAVLEPPVEQDANAMASEIVAASVVAEPEPAVAFVPAGAPFVEPFEAAAPEQLEELVATAPEPFATVATEGPEELIAAAPEPFEAIAAEQPEELVAAAPEPFEAFAGAVSDEVADEVAADAFVLVPPEPFEPTEDLQVAFEAVELRPDPDLQPLLRFDLEPEAIVEPAVEEVLAAAEIADVTTVSDFRSRTLGELDALADVLMTPADEVVVVPDVLDAADVADALVASVAAEVRVVSAASVPSVPSVIALERFLGKVRARRTQLMAESVA